MCSGLQFRTCCCAVLCSAALLRSSSQCRAIGQPILLWAYMAFCHVWAAKGGAGGAGRPAEAGGAGGADSRNCSWRVLVQQKRASGGGRSIEEGEFEESAGGVAAIFCLIHNYSTLPFSLQFFRDQDKSVSRCFSLAWLLAWSVSCISDDSPIR